MVMHEKRISCAALRRFLVAMPLLLALILLAMPAQARDPIIDIHLHASPADGQGSPPLAICTPMNPMPVWDQKVPWSDALVGYFKHPTCRNPIWSPLTDQEIKTKSLAIMQRFNIIGVVNDTHAQVLEWRAEAPNRVLPATPPTAEEMADPKLMLANYRKLKQAGEVMLIGEVVTQYFGISPDSPALEGLWSVAEELDLPVSLHIGPGPPGAAYLPGLGYRARMSNPLLLEDVLVRHPKLRLNLMHAGYPMLDDTLALLYAHPQVYVDVGGSFSPSRAQPFIAI